MNAIDRVELRLRRLENELEALVFAATAALVAGGTLLMCLPGFVHLG